MLALFGGVTFWLYAAHNGAFILVGCIAALKAIAFLLSVYSALFFKVYVDKDGFYSRTLLQSEGFKRNLEALLLYPKPLAAQRLPRIAPLKALSYFRENLVSESKILRSYCRNSDINPDTKYLIS